MWYSWNRSSKIRLLKRRRYPSGRTLLMIWSCSRMVLNIACLVCCLWSFVRKSKRKISCPRSGIYFSIKSRGIWRRIAVFGEVHFVECRTFPLITMQSPFWIVKLSDFYCYIQRTLLHINNFNCPMPVHGDVASRISGSAEFDIGINRYIYNFMWISLLFIFIILPVIWIRILFWFIRAWNCYRSNRIK